MLYSPRRLPSAAAILACGLAAFGLDAGLAVPAAPIWPRVVILDYHSFLGNAKSSMDYSDGQLAEQLDEIKAMGYRFVTLDDAIAGKIEGVANVVVTIDDGNHTVFKAYEEIFKPRGIEPELFIYPAIIGRIPSALTTAQLEELGAEGCGVGAHGYHHEHMSEHAYKEDPGKVMEEIEKPGPALERILGARPALFAYPFGVGCPEAEAALAVSGYSYAFTAVDRIEPVQFGDPGLNRYEVPRTIVYHWNRDRILEALAALLKN